MKNPRILMVLVLVALAAGGAYFFAASNDSKSDTPENAMIKKADDNTPTTQTAHYIEYTKDVFEINSYKRRVLFFYASWCPTCRPADADFKANENQIPEDVALIRVNYNDPETDQEEKGLAARYGITYQHTYVQIDEQGNEVAKWNGGSLEELLNQLINK